MAGVVGTDTGGTFTDVVDASGRVHKVLSDPDDPARAVAAGVSALFGQDRPDLLAHGTTVATNALLERRGARVALLTTEGMRDVIEIGRQDRPSLYDPFVDRPEPLVDRADRHEVRERLAADGSVLVPLDPSTVPDLSDAGAVAVCFLHSDLDPTHERIVADLLRSRGHDVSASHEVSPQFREYERTVTTVVNAYLRPSCRGYVGRLADLAPEVLVMTSAGGLVPAGVAADLPAALVLSGPAGGVRAGAAAALANGYADAVTFDMGGTSTDVCLVLGGEPAPAGERAVGGFDIRMPALDVHTIGAGGGSIAFVDPGGALQVGPRSAGARPGPACYGRGGTEPTVTDANVAAGRIPADATFPALGGRLDRDAAVAALASRGIDAAGVLAVVNASMERALRTVSVERGVDPRGLALVAFGGAGPLHACDLADALGMPVVIVPPRAGVLSAVGILTSPVRRDVVRTWPAPLDHTGLSEELAALGEEARRLVGGADAGAGAGGDGVVVGTAIDARYEGQSHELTVGSVPEFHAEHERRNGYSRPDTPVEVVAIRAWATRPASVAPGDLPPVERSPVAGPATVCEADCTIWVPEGWAGRPGPDGSLVLERARPGGAGR